jgi:hypothetical protein
MEKMFQFFNWLTLNDFNRVIENARLSVIKRFARGNVMFQNGYMLNEKGLDEVRRKGDLAIQRIIKRHRALDHANRQGVSN